ncbi:MAG: hypothetical protein CL583_10900 [Alteromonadaceae bacterium]|nr:hypothetical protein [Alteromonadaceae bacterium]
MPRRTRASQRPAADTPAGPEASTAAGLIRRLAAMLYDGLVCVALALVLTGIYTAVSAKIVGPELYQQQALANVGKFDPLLASILFVTLYLFFAYFWRHNGQTLGMQAWHLQIENEDGSRISWMQALLRYLMGWVSWLALGIGYLWVLFDRDRKAWTDRFSNSRMIRISPRRK